MPEDPDNSQDLNTSIVSDRENRKNFKSFVVISNKDNVLQDA